MPRAGFEAKRTTTDTLHEEGHQVCLSKHRTQQYTSHTRLNPT